MEAFRCSCAWCNAVELEMCLPYQLTCISKMKVLWDMPTFEKLSGWLSTEQHNIFTGSGYIRCQWISRCYLSTRRWFTSLQIIYMKVFL